jgi:hypothetical protein
MIHARHLPKAIQNIKCEFCKNRATWFFDDDKEDMVIVVCNVHKRLLEKEYNENVSKKQDLR